MTTTRPPQPGLTRENTGYPHDVHRGWFLTPAGLAAVERRVAQRSNQAPDITPTPTPTLAESRRAIKEREWRYRTGKAPKRCHGCDRPYTPVTSRQKYCQPDCRRRADYARAKARRLAERIAS